MDSRDASSAILLDRDARGVAWLTLNRPAAGNRYNPPMLTSLGSSIAALADDPAVRCVVLRAEGKHFCVGADINWHAKASDCEPDAPEGFLAMLLALDALPKPTLAVVQGGCIGGGLALAACCDVIIAATSAFFSIPEVRLGFAAEALIPLFQRAIGSRALRRYGLSGERFDVETAQRLGLVCEIFEPGGETSVLGPLLDAMLLGGPLAQGRTKRLAAEFEGDGLIPRMRQLEAGFAAAIAAPEPVEGMLAFRERRRPSWAT